MPGACRPGVGQVLVTVSPYLLHAADVTLSEHLYLKLGRSVCMSICMYVCMSICPTNFEQDQTCPGLVIRY